MPFKKVNRNHTEANMQLFWYLEQEVNNMEVLMFPMSLDGKCLKLPDSQQVSFITN